MNSGIKVLIIDDDRVFCQLLERGLSRLGYEAVTAHSTEQALNITANIEVILLDMRLGNESGLGLITALHDHFPGSKIIIVTGYASLATAVSAMKKGACNYIAKPVNVQDIHGIIQESLADVDESKSIVEPLPTQSPSLKRLEWEHIHRVLEENEGNISRTANKLGMHRRTLQRKLKKHTP